MAKQDKKSNTEAKEVKTSTSTSNSSSKTVVAGPAMRSTPPPQPAEQKPKQFKPGV